MGIKNVMRARQRWVGRVSPAAFSVLTRMAELSRDGEHPPRYWAGRDDLVVFGLGRCRGATEDDPPSPIGPADYRAVMRVLAELVKAGAISRVRLANGFRDRRETTEYALHITHLTLVRPVDNPVHRSPESG